MTKRGIDSIDLCKLLASLMIFAMHFQAFGANGELHGFFSALTRWGVPFFFLSSSYFLFRKLDRCATPAERLRALRRFSGRLLCLYAAWGLVNLPYILFDFCARLSPLGAAGLSSRLLLALKDYLLSACYFAAWYVPSLLVSVWLVYLLSRRVSGWMLLLAACPFQLCCVLASGGRGLLPLFNLRLFYSLDRLLADTLLFPYNLVSGVFYVSVGRLFASRAGGEGRSPKLTRRIGWALFAAAVLLYLGELRLLQRAGLLWSTDSTLGQIPVSVLLFYLCLGSDMRLRHGLLLRRLSIIIYFCQADLFLLRLALIRFLHVESFSVLFAVCALCCALCCWAVLSAQKTQRLRLAKLLL